MIDALFVDLENMVGVDGACRLTGRSKATYYRHRHGPRHGPRKPGPSPSNALTGVERDRVLALLRSPRFADLAVAQVWAMLLDDDIYLCSQATMHRLLREAGENRDRRRQRTILHVRRDGVTTPRVAIVSEGHDARGRRWLDQIGHLDELLQLRESPPCIHPINVDVEQNLRVKVVVTMPVTYSVRPRWAPRLRTVAAPDRKIRARTNEIHGPSGRSASRGQLVFRARSSGSAFFRSRHGFQSACARDRNQPSVTRLAPRLAQ